MDTTKRQKNDPDYIRNYTARFVNAPTLADLKKDFIAAMRIINHQGLSDAFAHLSARVNDGTRMLFMPRKSPILMSAKELFRG